MGPDSLNLRSYDWNVGVIDEIEELYESNDTRYFLLDLWGKNVKDTDLILDKSKSTTTESKKSETENSDKWRDGWEVIKDLGQGGQGKVFRVRDISELDMLDDRLAIASWIREFPIPIDDSTSDKRFERFRKALSNLLNSDVDKHGALKILHMPAAARDAELAEIRIQREIRAMSEVSHPNLLKILDADPDGKWYVSEFHPNGTLNNNLYKYKGNVLHALESFKYLVAGVAELHKKGLVHRDIKPHNIFLDSAHNLILGDFGLVYYIDNSHSRVSDMFENVGSRDWMPAWAMGMRVEDIKPSFDVFSLGKLLWSMISGSPILRLWYFDKPEFDLEQMFPDNMDIKFINRLLRKCIVENEHDCLNNASDLLSEIDKVLFLIENHADIINDNIKRKCKVCGIGNYDLIVDRNGAASANFGISPGGSRSFKIFTCGHCGHVQLFAFGNNSEPVAWES